MAKRKKVRVSEKQVSEEEEEQEMEHEDQNPSSSDEKTLYEVSNFGLLLSELGLFCLFVN